MKLTLLLICLIGLISSHKIEAFPSHAVAEDDCPNDSPTEVPLDRDDLDLFNNGQSDGEDAVNRDQVEAAKSNQKIKAIVAENEKESCRASFIYGEGLPKNHTKCPIFDWTKCFNRGLTWKIKKHECSSGLNLVGCHNCNPYSGDTWCFLQKRVLCIYKAQDVRPDYDITGSGAAMPVEFYHGWSGGHIKATKNVYYGCFIFSKLHADLICRWEFGTGWQMASHHDGRYMPGMGGMTHAYASWNWAASYGGGWNFYAYGDFEVTNEKFWTYIADQPGNCWN